ncbi:MAG: hypothetical protein PHY82_01270 [Lentisphaeria bacterium]|nr:hypothetical protein [Lentisphaeria bacterium]
MMQTPLTNQLRRIRKQLRFRQNCRNIAAVLCGLSLSLCLLGIWESAFTLSETASTFGLVGLFLLSTFALTYLGYRSRSRSGSLSQLALGIEHAHPELLDRLICAVELENRAAVSLTGLEQGLLQEMQQKYASGETFFPEVFRLQSPLKKTLFLLISGMLLLLPASQFAVFRKAQYFLSDFLAGQPSGIRLSVPGQEFAVHSDVRIQAEITRWENQAEIEIRESGPHGTNRYRQTMHLQDARRHAFTIYDLNQKLHFRIITPSLKTSWHPLAVFTPPAANSVQISTLPLPYTQHPVQNFSAFEDFTLTEGEGFQLETNLPEGVSARLQSDPPLPGTSSGDLMRVYPEKTAQFQAVLEDSAGHQTLCPPFTVTVEADLPPVLEVREPAQDSTIKPGDSLLLHIVARDDFGLSGLSLQFSVSGGARQKLALFQTGSPSAEKEYEHRDIWNLDELGLKDGDVLSGMVIATDNREPVAQSARSELFFVTVRPDANMMESEGDSGGEQKKADISDLLAESKRLLRLTWDTFSEQHTMEAKERERRQFELLRDVKELEVEVRRRFNKLQEESQGMMAEPIPSLFKQSSEFLNAAAALLERQLVEESLQPQELSLAALVRLENELLKNALKSKKQQGEGDSKENQEPSEAQQKQDEQNQQKQAQQNLETMKESLQELDSLLKRQQQLNQESADAATLPDELAKRQEKVRSDAQKTADKLQELPESLSASNSLKNAGSEMELGRDAFEESDLRRGNLHGQRAHKQLLQARRELEAALRQTGANQINRLADQAARLSAAQTQAAEKSQEQAASAEPSQNKELREQQKQLQKATEQLSHDIQQVSSLLEEDYPEASQALRSASQQADQRGLSKKQTRAGNALLYKQFEAAAKEQRDAANLLQALSQELQSSAEKLPPMSSEDLREMLQQLQQHADQLEAAARQGSEGRKRQQFQQIRDQAAQMLQNAADPLKDPRLQQIVDDLRMPDGEAPSGEIGEKVMSLFKAASAVLQEHLARFMLQNKMNFSRETIVPPRKYKRQVEEYFKDLGSE